MVVSSAIEPTDNVGSGSNIGANGAVAFARIQTPPPAVPTNIRPLTVGSTTMAVTLPVAPASGLPSSVPANTGVSFSRGWGPIEFHASGPVIADTLVAELLSIPAMRSWRRIRAIALR